MERIERIARLYPSVMKVMGRMRTALHEGMDLSYNQFKALLTIHDKGTCSLNDLAADLDVAASTTSEMVERLVCLGLVCRSVDSRSRRRVNISTTDQGRRLISDLENGIVDNYQVLLGKLSEKDQERLVAALETLVEVVGKL